MPADVFIATTKNICRILGLYRIAIYEENNCLKKYVNLPEKKTQLWTLTIYVTSIFKFLALLDFLTYSFALNKNCIDNVKIFYNLYSQKYAFLYCDMTKCSSS